MAISRLSRRFGINERGAVDGFRDYFLSKSNQPPPSKLKPFCQAVDSLVVSTAECERSFSVMNDIASDVRSSLGIRRISALMFAKMLGTEHCGAFHAKWYVRKWLSSGRHSADDTDSCKCEAIETNDYSHLHSIFE